jgi:hypothetical protein
LRKAFTVSMVGVGAVKNLGLAVGSGSTGTGAGACGAGAGGTATAWAKAAEAVRERRSTAAGSANRIFKEFLLGVVQVQIFWFCGL